MKKLFLFFPTILLIWGLAACSSEKEPIKKETDVSVVTLDVTDIEATTARSGGKVSTENGSEVSRKGICWSTSENPTTSDHSTTEGSGPGDFTSVMEGLVRDQVYYVRAYAVSGGETIYGRQVSFTAGQSPPTLTTNPVSGITTETATSGGTVTDKGNSEITDVGLCWSVDEFPTLNDDNTVEDLDGDTFTSQMVNLRPNTTYYVRAYAINKGGVGYGEQVSFTTVSESNYTVTDPKFQQYLLDNFDTNGDGLLQESEMLRVISIDLQDRAENMKIESLDGIKQFTNLKELRCNDNNIGSLDVAGMDKLEVLWAHRNGMTDINVEGCRSLQYLHIYENEISAIDISDCLDLRELEANGNNISGRLDLDNHKRLEKISLICNRVESLSARGIETLIGVWIDGNGLRTIDVSGSSLIELFCQENQLTSAEIKGCTALEMLCIFQNRLTSLDASGLTSLRTIEAEGNLLTELKVDGCLSLNRLVANANQLVSVDLSGCTELREVHINDNLLERFSFDACPNLELLGVINNRFTTLEMRDHKKIRGIWCDAGRIEKLDISGCNALTELFCQINRLTTIDLSGCSSLVTLNCWENPGLTSLDLTDCTNLDYVSTVLCSLTSLKLPDSNSLRDLRCAQNRLTSLEVHSTGLNELHCQDNLFATLDITGCGALDVIFAFNNPNLATFDVSGCPQTLKFLELNGCDRLATLYMKSGQTAQSFIVPEHTQVIYK